MTRSTLYVLMQRYEGSNVGLVSEIAKDGARAVFVFDELAAAEVFLILEDLGPGWEVIEHAPSATAELLEACADQGAGYVVVTPRARSPAGTKKSR